MKYIKAFLILTIAVLGFSYSNVSAQNYSNSAAVAPRTIERSVFKELKKLPYYGVFDFISYRVDGSTVTLSGKVTVARNKKDAERFIKDVAGVGNVVNNIEILPLSSYDNSIRQQILRSFLDKGLYNYLWEQDPAVRIIVDNGRVELEGYVGNKGSHDLMNILANQVPGVFNVENHLIIDNGRDQ